MKDKIIPINCAGSRTIKYTEFKKFQGKLKEMSKVNYDKLKGQILEHGWISPVYVWNEIEILDGHGRLLVLDTLIKQGYDIAEIPVVDIMCKTRKEAGKILLAINSNYQTITKDGLYEYMCDFEILPIELENFVLPNIDMESFNAEFELEPNPENDKGTEDKVCPHCGKKL